MNHLGVKVGDRILLKDSSGVQPWARGMVFEVTEVRAWGVVCVGGEAGDIPMRAAWSDIDRIVEGEAVGA